MRAANFELNPEQKKMIMLENNMALLSSVTNQLKEKIKDIEENMTAMARELRRY